MGNLKKDRVRMAAERHWERFDEAAYDNANQMRVCAEDAIQELLTREWEKPALKPHLFAELANELRSTAVKYKDTQQLRAQIVAVLDKYVDKL